MGRSGGQRRGKGRKPLPQRAGGPGPLRGGSNPCGGPPQCPAEADHLSHSFSSEAGRNKSAHPPTLAFSERFPWVSRVAANVGRYAPRFPCLAGGKDPRGRFQENRPAGPCRRPEDTVSSLSPGIGLRPPHEESREAQLRICPETEPRERIPEEATSGPRDFAAPLWPASGPACPPDLPGRPSLALEGNSRKQVPRPEEGAEEKKPAGEEQEDQNPESGPAKAGPGLPRWGKEGHGDARNLSRLRWSVDGKRAVDWGCEGAGPLLHSPP